MKVGTDANILSVWCDLKDINSVLDIGTGSGVIAMVLASRSDVNIDAIEIDEASVSEARQNFTNSPYLDRLSIVQGDFKEFSLSNQSKYDLAISNPPFFSNFPLSNKKESRNKARHTINLNHDQLLEGVVKVLKPNGRFVLVLPYDIHKGVINKANQLGMQLWRQLLIYPKPDSMPNRINMEFRFGLPYKIKSDDFYVRTEEGYFTKQYKEFFREHLTDFLF